MAPTTLALLTLILLGQAVLVGSLYFIGRYGRAWAVRVVDDSIARQDDRLRKRVSREPRTDAGPVQDVAEPQEIPQTTLKAGQPYRRLS